MPGGGPPDGARLRRCDLAACEAVCCHDGAWLTDDDEKRLRLAIRAAPEVFSGLPRVKVVTAGAGVDRGRKTAVRPHVYRQRPAHFTDTRCVFADPAGRCTLQLAAVQLGEHPWAYKPLACWLHPLRLTAGADGEPALLPPALPGADPDAAPGYPGYATFTPCGRHEPDAPPWTDTLADEIAYHAR